MSMHSLAQARVIDAAGNSLRIDRVDDGGVTLCWPDGIALRVSDTLLEQQQDGSYLLPLTPSATTDGGQVDGMRLPVMEERLRVERREVASGGVRVRKSVHSHDEDVELALASEQLQVERVAIGAVLPADTVPRMREEGDTVVIPVLEEQLVVRKQLVLKEELRITRVHSVRHERNTETLRTEQLDVEPLKGPAH